MNELNPPFALGDTVRLKSGGPIMTIHSISNFGSRINIQCIWFDELTKRPILEYFKPETLTLKKVIR